MKYPVLRSVVLIGISVLWSGLVFAQSNINRIEYYFDFDPGHGNGTAISFTADTAISLTSTSIPISNLARGFHYLGLRARNADNAWSPTIVQPFFKEHIIIPPAQDRYISAMEYFIDQDPGFGNANVVQISNDVEIKDFSFVVPLNNVTEGMHWFSVRAKDNYNQWSTVVVRPFIKATIPATPALKNIVQIEYFIDFDPGFGNASAVSFQPGSLVSNLNIMADLSNIPEGTHKVFVRAKNTDDVWSTVGVREFTVCSTPVNASISITGSSTVCEGQSVTLSVPAGNSYQWTINGADIGGATSNTYLATQSGEYSVKITRNACVSSPTPVSVTVNSNSQAPTLETSTPTICRGSVAELRASNCNGTVTWSTGSTQNPLLVSPTTTTSYTATCKPLGCTIASPVSNTIQIVVDNTTLSLAINGAPTSAVCPNTSSTLTLTGCTGSIEWDNGATTSTINVTSAKTTTYKASCSVNTCTATTSKTITVVSPSPAALVINTPNQAICAGESVTLTASNCTGGTIAWSNGTTGSTVSVSPAVSTTYTATCTIGSCTATSMNGVMIDVRNIVAAPIVSTASQAVCRGTKVQLNAGYCYGVVSWSNGTTGNTIVVEPQVTTTYTATCLYNNCQSSNSNAATITVSDCADPSNFITHLEYFIDNDPGFGNGTAISGFTSNPAVNNLSVNIPLNNISEGFHYLSIRARDANNKWGPMVVRPFLKIFSNTPVTPPNIVKIEYFYDNDPGFGNGIDYPITAGQQINEMLLQLPLTSLAEGKHWVNVRVKDANNKWTTVVVRPFVKEPVETNASLSSFEYFIDTDPGFGNGTSVGITAQTSNLREAAVNTGITSGKVSANVNLSTISNGEHRLFVRAKDSKNKWGTVGVSTFYKQSHLALVGAAPASSCSVNPFSIPFTISGTYTSGNVFTVQLSDRFGSFDNPISLGTLTSTSAGTITASIPYGTPYGKGYKIRIVSSNPVITTNPAKDFEVVSICPAPCAGLLTLTSPADDYSSLSITKKANASNGRINANNKVKNGANITYQAKSILLSAGFSTDSGTVFKAEIGGCN